jgi:hypothetical protein
MNTSIVLFADNINTSIVVNESNFINLEREFNTVGARRLETVVVFDLYKLLTFDNSVFKPREHFNCIIC